MTLVNLQEVLSVGRGTFMDETVPRANKVDIRVLWNIKQPSYFLKWRNIALCSFCVTVQLSLDIPLKHNRNNYNYLSDMHCIKR